MARTRLACNRTAIFEPLERRLCLSVVTPALSSVVDCSSNPSPPVSIGSVPYFAADDGTGNRALWKTDGTAAGTIAVKDFANLQGTAALGGLVAFNGKLYFRFDDVLWSSDGTAANTQPLHDAAGDNIPGPAEVVDLNGTLLFIDTAQDAIYETDGTGPGTQLLDGMLSVAHGLTVVDSNVFFFSYLPHGASLGLYETDGTPSGTHLTRAFANYPRDTPAPAAFGGWLYFQAPDAAGDFQTWKTDGVSFQLLDDDAWSETFVPPLTPVAFGSDVYYAKNTSSTGLWKTDGTFAGTTSVGGPAQLTMLSAAGSHLFFQDRSGGLWVSDGSPSGTVLLTSALKVQSMLPLGNEMYFIADDGTSGSELWKSDGTLAGTMLVKDINPGAGSAFDPQAQLGKFNGKLFFSANDASVGFEPWTSDGTAAGTTLLKDLDTVSGAALTITGRVFDDANGNGMQDPGEAGVAGAGVSADLFPYGNPGGSAVTASDGSFTISGLAAGRYVVSTQSPGWQQDLSQNLYVVFLSADLATPPVNLGAYHSASLTPRVIADLNDNGAIDPGEPSIQPITYADLNNDGRMESDEPQTFGGDGKFGFGNLPPGTYPIAVDESSGNTMTFPTARGARVAVAEGQTVQNVTLGVVENNGASITGRVYADTNGDGVEINEPPIGQAQVYLDQNGDGILDNSEPVTQTSSDGIFGFNHLPDGTYQVRVVVPPGDGVTTPAADYYNAVISNGKSNNVAYFGVAPAAPVTVSGHVFNDANGNSQLDPGEALAGWQIYIDLNKDGHVEPGEPSALSDASGAYVLSGVLPKQIVREVLQPQWSAVRPAGGAVVPFGGSSTMTVDFVNTAAPGGLLLPAGSLDPSFGIGGQLNGPIASAVQHSGKMIMLDTGILKRFNADGSPDTSFGAAGSVALPLDFGIFSSLFIQPDDNIVVVAGDNVQIVQLTPDGVPVASFGEGGEAAVTAAANHTVVATQVQEDGKILLLETANQGLLLARFNSDGTPDTAFGNAGSVSVGQATGFPSIQPQAMALLPSGTIVVLSFDMAKSHRSSAAVVRGFNSDGTLAAGFGGRVAGVNPSRDFGMLAVAPDGSIRSVVSVRGSIKVEKFSSNGAMDLTFGRNGIATTSLHASGAYDFIRPAVAADGKITVAAMVESTVHDPGYIVHGFNLDNPLRFIVGLLRLNADGSRDSTFALKGRVIISTIVTVNPFFLGALELTLAPNGDPLVVTNNSSEEVETFRFLSVPQPSFAAPKGHTLTIVGSTADDILGLESIPGSSTPTGQPALRVTLNGVSLNFDAANIKDVRVVWPGHGSKDHVAVPLSATLADLLGPT